MEFTIYIQYFLFVADHVSLTNNLHRKLPSVYNLRLLEQHTKYLWCTVQNISEGSESISQPLKIDQLLPATDIAGANVQTFPFTQDFPTHPPNEEHIILMENQLH